MKYLGKSLVFTAVLSASISSAFSEETASGKLTFETANFTKAGTTTGADNTHASGDSMKQEISARFYLDGDINDNTTYHLELQGYSNSKAVADNDTNRSYTQRDPLREAYIDTTYGDWLIRAGKQQVVWGTADGMKLLDMINPTDYTEMAQNQMEDSRIPVFMLNAETQLEDGSSIQAVISEPKENIFAGLDRDTDTTTRSNTFLRNTTNTMGGTNYGYGSMYLGGVIDHSITANGQTYASSNDTGHPFKLMGPDSITGDKNGFLNIVPDMGGVASQFGYQFTNNDNAGGIDFDGDGNTSDAGDIGPSLTGADSTFAAGTGVVAIDGLNDGRMNYFTVQGFTASSLAQSNYNFNAMNGTFEAKNFGNTAAGMKDSLGNATPWNVDETDALGYAVGELKTGTHTSTNATIAVNNALPFNVGDIVTIGTSDYEVLSKDLTAGANTLTFTTTIAATDAGTTIVQKPTTSAPNTAVMGSSALAAFTSAYDSNLYNPTTAAKDSAFEYMDRATFKTFDTFGGAKSKYVYKMPSLDKGDLDVAFRYKNTTPSGVNYSLNYAYAYDKNPIINTYWINDAGTKLYQAIQPVTLPNGQKTASISLYDTAAAAATNSAALLQDMSNSAVSQYGSAASNTATGKYATLVFEQETKRVHNIGGSFDMAIDTDQLGPVVIRGEALYMKDTYTPIMNLGHLSYGNLVDALTMKKGDRFKYVLGADITALTNMMVSAQFIQDINLDYVDNAKDWNGDACASGATNCGEFTTDYPTMHLTNNFNKASKNKNFYSLFLSKPFGASDQHRWNNIMMFEQGGGRWNRLDAEYAINDNTVATFEWNKYWGENNTQFGQLKNSSNIQAGIKYSF